MMRRVPRTAFTLVELLVAMAVVISLATIALIIVPDALNQDRTTDGAATVRQTLMIAKARALRDNANRGVRLIVSADPNNLVKGGNTQWVTELQYIEAPPLLNSIVNGTANVVFSYSYDGSGNISGAKNCQVQNLDAADVPMIVPGCLLSLPTLGTSHRITSVTPSGTSATLVLDSYPDSALGAAGQPGASSLPVFATTKFGIAPAPQPIVGEPTIQLPKNICVDLGVSSPAGGGTDYDIVFLPNGQVMPYPSVSTSSQIFLWVRDYTKTATATDFAHGGEQQVVALKAKSGTLGVFPVAWTGDPFQFARQGATSP